jgi:arylsulfatase A
MRYGATCAGAVALLAGEGISALPLLAQGRRRRRPPNIVLIFVDDLGYGDIGCFGADDIPTPHIDRMAEQGAKYTDFYVAGPACSPSRAALLTGCYPQRVGIPHVLFPEDDHGLNPDETTIADLLGGNGYATACIGKWHLGHHEALLPPHHGFDVYFGIPYSNDMSPDPKHNETERARSWPPLPMYRGSDVVEVEPDQAELTRRFTEESIRFMEQNRDRPFFLYLPHPMPHVPLFASEQFQGVSQRGLYGDVVAELDWSCGQIVEAIQRLELDEDTLVIFTSDNGPWLEKGDHGGRAGPLRAGKGSAFEGGMRVPCVMRWPGVIPEGSVCAQPASTLDFYRTFAALAGARVPQDLVLDGSDMRHLLTHPEQADSRRPEFFYWEGEALRAVRSGRWKFHRTSRWGGDELSPALYDLEQDIGEQHNLVDRYPKLADGLRRRMEVHEREVRANQRPPGRVERDQSIEDADG